jgi:hypothetical protein
VRFALREERCFAAVLLGINTQSDLDIRSESCETEQAVKDIPIIFELVIVGFEVLAWILLLILALFGYQWINLDFVTQWATQLSFGLVGLAYMFGLIFDKAVSSLPFGWIVGHGAVAETANLPSPAPDVNASTRQESRHLCRTAKAN